MTRRSPSNRTLAPSLRRAMLGILPVMLACSSGADNNGDAGPPADVAIADSADDTANAPDATVDLPQGPLLESTAECALSGIRTVQVAATPAAGAPRLNLRYRVFPSARKDAPVIVVVPGGPGQALIEDDPRRAFALSAAPLDAFTVIYTDARGSGCNLFANVGQPDDEVYTIARVAEDLAAVIRKENLVDYYLFGASFGTTVVTVAVHQMEARGEPLPRRIVLEGTLGRAFASFEDYFAAFATEWRRVEPLLDAPWREAFQTEPWPSLLKWSRQQWGVFISAQLILGDYPGHGHLLDYWLKGMSAKDASATAYVSSYMQRIPEDGPTEPPGALFRTIACRELWGGWRSGREIRQGELRATGDDACLGVAGVRSALYDASAFTSSVPAVYFQGPFDPTTTLEQAEHHFVSRRGSQRVFATIPDAAHAPLTLGLAGRGCASDVWRAIAGEGEPLKEVLSACARDAEVIDVRTRAD